MKRLTGNFVATIFALTIAMPSIGANYAWACESASDQAACSKSSEEHHDCSNEKECKKCHRGKKGAHKKHHHDDAATDGKKSE